MNETSTRTTHDHNHDRPPATDRRTRPSGTAARGPHFAPARHLDPLRTVQGSLALYDCPDLATLDGHLRTLRRRPACTPRPAGPRRTGPTWTACLTGGSGSNSARGRTRGPFSGQSWPRCG